MAARDPIRRRATEISLTHWWRLEPRGRDAEMERSLQAQVRDPLWMLARQWQVGEFLGSDGGSPISAQVATSAMPLTSYRPGAAGGVGALSPLDTAALPLEARVEREPVQLGLRGSVQLGQRFEALLLAARFRAAVVAAFRAAYPIDASAPSGPPEDVPSRRMRLLAAGRCVDGVALLATAALHSADLTQAAPIPSLPSGQRAGVAGVLRALLEERAALYSEPQDDGAWTSRQLEYDFALGVEDAAPDAGGSGGTLALSAGGFGGGELEWHAFDLDPGGLGSPSGAEVAHELRAFVPTNVVFRGMPGGRWWSFEDAQTDFGALDVAHVDLVKLLVMEFALVYGGDWFNVPLPLPIGTLCSVERLLVTDTFGVQTLIRPTSAQPLAGQRPWSMFALSGEPAGRDMLLLAPTLGARLDGGNVEEVLFVRDELAAMGWAIERKLQGPLDAAVDGYETYLARIAADPPPALRTRTPGGPPIEYELGTTVPDNWIPLVAVQTGERSFLFRRGVMGSPTGGAPPTARSRVLEPGHPFYVADEAIPRAGVQAERRFRRARWIDGSTYVWDARRVRVGRGEGSSGLAFDTIRQLGEPPA